MSQKNTNFARKIRIRFMSKKSTDIVSTQASPVTSSHIQSRILNFRGKQVLADRDLAELYGVETRRINEQVKRNIERFPERFMFQLNDEEFKIWKSQIATSNFDAEESEANWTSQNATSNSIKMGVRRAPYVFTEQGVAMLATILKSPEAVRTSLAIMDAFVAMRHFLIANAGMFQRLQEMERHQIESDRRIESTEQKLDKVLQALDGPTEPIHRVFFNGEMFDAFMLIKQLLQTATRRIVIIDNYANEDVLARLSERPAGTSADIYMQERQQKPTFITALESYKAQFPSLPVTVHTFEDSHDRWLIIDDTVYHLGASIKDLGKRWFAINTLTEPTAEELISRLP